MNLYKFLNGSMEDSDFDSKMSTIARMYSKIHMKDFEGVSESISELTDFVDTKESFCLFLETNTDFIHIKENEDISLGESTDFTLNKETGFYDFNIICNDNYDWTFNKIFLPGTLFFIYYDPKAKPLKFKTFLEKCGKALSDETKVENIRIEDSVTPENLYFNDKDTGDSTQIRKEGEYSIKLRTFIFDYSKYQKYIDNMDYALLTTTPGKRITGILDEMSEDDKKNFNLNTLCDYIYQEMIKAENDLSKVPSKETLEKIRKIREKFLQKNQEIKED